MSCSLLDSLVLSMGLVLVVVVVTLASLVVADWAEAQDRKSGLLPQLVYALDGGDHLHYVVHLVLGRVLDLCPGTRSLAEEQYRRAMAHARTGHQLALVTSQQPTTLRQRVADAAGMLGSGVRWGARGATWLVSSVASRISS